MIVNTKIKAKGQPSRTIKYQGNFLRQFDFNLGCLASSPVVATQIDLASIMTTTEALTMAPGNLTCMVRPMTHPRQMVGPPIQLWTLTPMSLSVKDAAIIAAVSGVTTLSVRFTYALLRWVANWCIFYLQVFLQGALTVAIPTIGKDLNFRQVSETVSPSVSPIS